MSDPVWTAFLVNLLFWSGMAAGAVAFDGLLDVTGAAWASPLRALARRFRRFLPISVVLYAAGFAMARTFHWRDAAAFAASAVAAFSPPVVFLIVYPVAWSLIAIDVVMSLEPGWASTLFPAYVFAANVYAAAGAVAIAASLSRRRDVLDAARSRDLGTVLLGFALIWIYFTWTQVLVIWYGNLPAESAYVAKRLSGGWTAVAWFVFVARCALPVLVLLPRAGRTRLPLALVGATVVAGFWMECWLMVVPARPGAFTASATAATTAVFCVLFAAAWSWPPPRPRPRAAPLQSATAGGGPSHSL